jgi:hypothetical protein
MDKELAASERRFADEPSARNLGRLNTVRNQAAAARGALAPALDQREDSQTRRDREGS